MMGCVRVCFIFLVILTFIDFHQCGRSSDPEIQSTVGPDNPQVVPLQALAYRTTRRSHGTLRTTPRSTTPRRTTTRPTTRRTTTRPWTTTTRRTTTRPWTTTTRRTTTRPWTTTTRRTTTRPWTTTTTTTRPWTTTTRRTTTRPWTTTTRRTTTRPWTTTTRRTTTRPWTTTTRPWTTKTLTRRTTTTYRPPTRTTTRRTIRTSTMRPFLPPRPGSEYYGKIEHKTVNKYNVVVYPGYYPLPVPHHQYPGYVQTITSYRYAPSDTGSTALGFYLGYKLGQLTTPTYSHQTFYDGYRPRYDHYEVHHYYHNSESVPREQRIVSNTIVGCVGDSTSVCPANTTSLCTSDGKLMCVVTVAALTDCIDAKNQRIKCVKSTISCVNNTAPECKGNSGSTVTVDVPCVSTAKIEGDIQYVNNTIVKNTQSVPNNCTRSTVSCVNTTGTDNIQTSNCTTITVSCNNTTGTNHTRNCTVTTVSCVSTVDSTNQTSNCRTSIVSCINSTTAECAKITNTTCVSTEMVDTSTHNQYINGTASPSNQSTDCTNMTNSTASVLCGEMKYVNNPSVVGTTVVPTTTIPSTTSVHWQWKRSVPSVSQDFCVTVLAVPARRVPTEGEVFFDDASNVLAKFVEAAWNM